jgi:hypothetical protein
MEKRGRPVNRRLTALALLSISSLSISALAISSLALAGCEPDAPPASAVSPSGWGAWAGTYTGHGFTFTIDPQGAGRLSYRTYLNCDDAADVSAQPGVPCEAPYASNAGQVAFTLAQAGGQTVARITASNDARVQGEAQLALIAPGQVRLSSGRTFVFTGCTDAVRPVPRDCGGA